MSLSLLQSARLRVQDLPTLFDRTFVGDGTASAFILPNRNLQSASAYIPIGAGGTAWSATGATFNTADGQVAFSASISANSAYRISYVFSTFSDDDMTSFISAGNGTVNGAALQACVTLMFDAAKRASWHAPDGASFDDTQAMGHLREMYKMLQNEVEKDAVVGGGFANWGEQQSSW